MSAFSVFDFSQDYIIEDERVLLRPLKLEDFDVLANFVHMEPDIWQYSLMSIQTETDLKQYLSIAVQSRKDKTAYPFIVFDKQSQKFVGSTRFYDMQLDYGSTQLGYTWYGKATWGSGINTHCKYVLLQFAFEQMGWDRVEFRADNDNKRSIAAMKKIGCTIEGVLRSHLPKPNGGRRDSIVLSILKNEWLSIVKQKLQAQL
jgi:RimJ/RimL family protein N-acetyltransferase